MKVDARFIGLIFSVLIFGSLLGCSELHETDTKPNAPTPRYSPPAYIPDPIPDPEQPLPQGPIQGFFSYGVNGYYGNALGEYCQFVSFSQWKTSGGPEDVSTVPVPASIPASMTFKGSCWYRGFFASNGIGYYGNNQGHYCYFDSHDQWLLSGGPSDPALIEQFATIPSTMVNDGLCTPVLPEGFFRYGDGGYYANDEGEYCRFVNFTQWRKSGGPEDVSGTAKFDKIPSVMKDKGTCWHREFFSVEGIGYYGNDQGHYCRFENFEQWLFKGGPSDPAAIERYATIPSSMVDDGICSPVIPQGFFRHADGGYYANEKGEYCRFASFSQWRKSGGPEDVTTVMELQYFPSAMKDNGICTYREFFSSNGIGYYGNDQGHYCRFETFDQWLAKGGPSDSASGEQFASVPTSMIDDGVCQ